MTTVILELNKNVPGSIGHPFSGPIREIVYDFWRPEYAADAVLAWAEVSRAAVWLVAHGSDGHAIGSIRLNGPREEKIEIQKFIECNKGSRLVVRQASGLP